MVRVDKEERMTLTTWQREDARRIAGLIKEIDICMLVTRADGSVRGRPMSNNGKVEYDGDSWFFSYDDSEMITEIGKDATVELAYMATDRGTWVSIEGAAEVVRDDGKKRELWEEELAQWFQDGPDDESVVLVKVRALRVHAWTDGEELVFEPGKEVVRIQGD
jgi:general stress protein 26